MCVCVRGALCMHEQICMNCGSFHSIPFPSHFGRTPACDLHSKRQISLYSLTVLFPLPLPYRRTAGPSACGEFVENHMIFKYYNSLSRLFRHATKMRETKNKTAENQKKTTTRECERKSQIPVYMCALILLCRCFFCSRCTEESSHTHSNRTN